MSQFSCQVQKNGMLVPKIRDLLTTYNVLQPVEWLSELHPIWGPPDHTLRVSQADIIVIQLHRDIKAFCLWNCLLSWRAFIGTSWPHTPQYTMQNQPLTYPFLCFKIIVQNVVRRRNPQDIQFRVQTKCWFISGTLCNEKRISITIQIFSPCRCLLFSSDIIVRNRKTLDTIRKFLIIVHSSQQ